MSAPISAIARRWPFGQLEGEEAADSRVDQGRGLQRRGLPQVVLLPPFDGQGQPEQEELLVGQPPPGGQLFHAARGVDLLDRLVQRPEVVGLEIFVGKNLLQQVAVGGDGLGDDLADLPLLQALSQRIDRQDPHHVLMVGGASSSSPHQSTLGCDICQTRPLSFGLPAKTTRCPSLNFSSMKGWLNHSPRRCPPPERTSTPSRHLPGWLPRSSMSSTMPQTLCSLSSSSCCGLAEVGHVLVGPREEEEHVAGRAGRAAAAIRPVADRRL